MLSEDEEDCSSGDDTLYSNSKDSVSSSQAQEMSKISDVGESVLLDNETEEGLLSSELENELKAREESYSSDGFEDDNIVLSDDDDEITRLAANNIKIKFVRQRDAVRYAEKQGLIFDKKHETYAYFFEIYEDKNNNINLLVNFENILKCLLSNLF